MKVIKGGYIMKTNFHLQQGNILKTRIAPMLVLLLILCSGPVYSQNEESIPSVTTAKSRSVDLIKPPLKRHWVDLGVGIGLDYGGFVGIKGAFLPIPNLSVFGSAGYYLIGLGWNTGITWHILAPGPKRWIRPNLKLMYGTNGATVVSGAKSYNKIFTGLTPGFGIELRFGRGKRNGFDLDINVPIHGADFHNQVNRMRSDERLVGDIKTFPVAISFGYHHAF